MTEERVPRSTAQATHPVPTWEGADRPLLDRMPSGFALHEMICDQEGRPIDYRFLYVNPAFEHSTGLRAEALIGKTALQVLPGLERHWIETYGRVALTGESVHFRNRSEPLGREFEVTAYQTVNGHFACFVEDVTESTKAQNALAEHERRFQSIMDNIPDLVWYKDRQSRFISVNEAFARTCGRTTEELVGKTDLDIWPKELAEHYRADDFEVMSNAERKQVVEGLVDKDGRKRWVETIKTPIRNDHGDVIGTAGIARDVTERRDAESALERHALRNETLLRSASDGIHILDTDGNVLEANEAFCRMLGYSHEEALKLNVTQWDMRWSPDELRDQILPNIPSERLVFETKHRRRDGQVIDVEVSTVRVEIEGKKLIFAASRDITERKQAEEELARSAAELAEANQLKDVFTDILRHDIMNPVTAIKAAVQVLAGRESDRQKETILKSMERSISSLIEMTDNAARYARLANTKDVEFSRADLADMIRALPHDFEAQLREKEVAVQVVSAREALAEVNPMVKEVFANLISNAIKYGPAHDEIEVRIDDQGDSWMVAVKDHGEGISDTNKQRIFNRFERIGKQGVKGSGLGLAIAHRIVAMHAGKIWVEDNPQGGCVFLVQLPKQRRH